MKTTLANAQVKAKWYTVNADSAPLGRLAVRVANVLRGRHLPDYTPHLDANCHVIVLNAKNVVFTGKKEAQKRYMFFSGWRGNEKYRSVGFFREKRADFLVKHAVEGMLPRNRLSRQALKKLRVFDGDSHPHEAQNPLPLPE